MHAFHRKAKKKKKRKCRIYLFIYYHHIFIVFQRSMWHTKSQATLIASIVLEINKHIDRYKIRYIHTIIHI